MVDDVNEDDAADNESAGKEHGDLGAAIQKIADGKERRPNHHATGNPASRGQSHVVAMQGGFGFADARFLADFRPARSGGMDFFVERNETFTARWRAEPRGQQPADRGKADAIKNGLREGKSV